MSSPFFPYATISEFFEAEGDFPENLTEAEEALDQEIYRAQQAAEDEQTHWEQDPAYMALYFPPEEE